MAYIKQIAKIVFSLLLFFILFGVFLPKQVLASTFSYSGLLLNNDNVPIPNAKLVISNSTASDETITDSNGSFLLQVPPGDYSLTIIINSTVSSLISPYGVIFVPNLSITDNTVQNLTVPTKKITVKTIDTENNPVQGATYNVRTDGQNVLPFSLGNGISGFVSQEIGVSSLETDSSGEATVEFLPSSSILIIATTPFGLDDSLTTTLLASDPGYFTIQFPQTVVYQGILQNGDGVAIPNGMINLANQNYSFTTHTDQTGTFSLHVPPASDYNLTAQSPNKWPYSPYAVLAVYGMPINSDVTQNLTIPTQDFTIKVLDQSGQPLQGAHVSVIALSQDILPLSLYSNVPAAISGDVGIDGTTDNNGVVVLPFLPSSQVNINVDYPSLPTKSLSTTFLAAKTFTILTTDSLSGTVYNDANQNGIQDTGETGVSGATITLNTNQTVITDSNGNYSFPGLADGTYTETLTLPNGYTATTTNPASISLSADITQNFGIALAGPTLVTAINSGGDTQGSYLADTYYTGGTQYISSAPVDMSGISNPAPQAVYQSVRYGNFSYTIPNLTPNGTYTIRLHFNELYWGTALSGNSGGLGSRIFNVSINSTEVLNNYDIYQKAGGSNIATTEQFPVTSDENGNVTIQFTTVTDNAMVNGIELYSGTLPSPTPTPTPTPAMSAIINAGGNTAGSFQTDKEYSGGTTYTSTASVDMGSVTNPAPEAVYQSARYGNFTYTIPNLTPDTNFLVRLHFNELYWGTDLSGNAGGADSRVFNVSINGQQVLSNFDIFTTAGGANKALVKEFEKPSDSTGKITIQFTTVTDNAMVNGIEIIPQ
jgi:hypothetical protein